MISPTWIGLAMSLIACGSSSSEPNPCVNDTDAQLVCGIIGKGHTGSFFVCDCPAVKLPSGHTVYCCPMAPGSPRGE